MLKTALDNWKLKHAIADLCVFLRNDLIVRVYVDDCILLSKNPDATKNFITSLEQGPEQFVFTDKGTLQRYLGVEIEKSPDGCRFSMRQPFFIQCIIDAVNIDIQMTNHHLITVVGPLLSKDPDGPLRKHDWKYCTLMGMLGYLQGTSRPEISMAVHQ